MKKTLCLDFDGVLHSYRSGWEGPNVVSDPPVPGALEFLAEAVKHFHVCIHSSRSHQPGGKQAMQAWLISWAAHSPHLGLEWIDRIAWPDFKPSAFVTLDDRAITFTGAWPAMEQLHSFEPWYRLKKKKEETR